MKTPDPDGSLNYGQADELDRELNNRSTTRGSDPLNTLLKDEFDREIDDERLYTDEFIRANENASRSLFLGFLGIALLGTSLFAFFVISQPEEEERTPSPESIQVPSIPTAPIPINPTPAIPTVPLNPNPSVPSNSTNPPQSPLVFPVNPANPNPGNLRTESSGTSNPPPPPPAIETP